MGKSKELDELEMLARTFDPQQAINAATAIQNNTSTLPLENKNVLIIDEAPATRRALQEQVSVLGSKSIQFATTASEAEQYLLDKQFALVICEYHLEGERNGQQLLEHLRTQEIIGRKTAFMLVTAERAYSNVVSAAEFIPDDYLIKPFTTSNLSDRITKLINKKERLSSVYKAMEDRDYSRVPSLCAVLEKQYLAYANDLERMRIESVYLDGFIEETQALIIDSIKGRPKPWMLLLLGKVQLANREFEQAEINFKKLVRENPEFLAAFDCYAEVLWELNKPEEALQVLEKLGKRAQGSTNRLRKLAELSMRLGDTNRSKNYLNKAIDRSKENEPIEPRDYLQLAQILTREGRHQEAENLTLRLNHIVDPEQLEVSKTIMAVQRLMQERALATARAKLNGLFRTKQEAICELDLDIKTSLLEQCFFVGMETEGHALASAILRENPGKALLDRIRFVETSKVFWPEVS